ncbi:hypothetical protein HELRODRAFT_170028 [Helobdella robusta]|uniref:Uncharacterized protein n=1 Tax=Helobdella robusta TaxID=6412 RepID=T1F2K1_HELRO|nr:hypothetical protein HELRODRAFT_170028 [Helobdella robusta]ESO07493.1 hypothetical protein HELRODRAFT_170028 [Helobdella robusta]
MDKTSRKRSSTSGDFVYDHVKAVVLEFADVMVAFNHVKDQIHDYVKGNVSEYLKENFEKDEIKSFVDSFRKETGEGLVAIPESGEDEILKAVVDNFLTVLGKSCDHHHKINVVVALLVKKAIEKKEFHEDVHSSIKQWAEKKVKVVVLAPCSCDVIKSLLISGGVSESDVTVESLGEDPRSVKESYVKLADKIQLSPSDVLFITTSPHEATASSAAGLLVVLVKMASADKCCEEEGQDAFRVVHNLKDVFKISYSDVIPHKISRNEAVEEVAKS